MYTRFETIPFALTKCLVITNKYLVKEAVYRAVNEVCTTSEKLMLFNKYTRLMKTGIIYHKIQLTARLVDTLPSCRLWV